MDTNGHENAGRGTPLLIGTACHVFAKVFSRQSARPPAGLYSCSLVFIRGCAAWIRRRQRVTNNCGDTLPGSGDDVVISGVPADVMITLGGSVTVRSLQCSASLNLAGGLALTKGASRIAGNFSDGAIQSLPVTGADTSLRVDGVTSATNLNLYASGGALVRLLNLQSADNRYLGVDQSWEANGLGSLVEASAANRPPKNVLTEQISFPVHSSLHAMTLISNKCKPRPRNE